MAVVNIQRVADSTGTLVPALRAIKFGSGFAVVVHPNDSLAGAQGGDGQVTGYLEVTATGAASNNTVSTANATPTPVGSIAVAAGKTLIVEAHVTLDGGSGNRGTIVALIAAKNVAGVVSLIGPVDVVASFIDTALFGVDFDFVVSGTNVRGQVTGLGATGITWSVNLSFFQ